MLNNNFDVRIISGFDISFRKRSVSCSISLVKIWESPFIALKKRIIHSNIAWIFTGKPVPPVVRLIASVAIMAKEIDTLNAYLFRNSTL